MKLKIKIIVIISSFIINLFLLNLINTAVSAADINCQITFYIEDNTNGEFKEDITVTLTDIVTENQYTYTLTSQNSYEKGLTYKGGVITGETTYLIDIDYPSRNDYNITHFNGSDIAMFSLTTSRIDFNWKINRASNVMPTQTAADLYDNAEGIRLFNEFVEVMKPTDGNQEWYGFYLAVTAYEKLISEQYVNYCGGTDDEWKTKTQFEQFFWYDTYIRLYHYTTLGAYDAVFATEEKFLNSAVMNTLYRLNTYGNGTEEEAYKKLMIWQYNRFIETGKFYNFMADTDTNNTSDTESKNNYISAESTSVDITQDNEITETANVQEQEAVQKITERDTEKQSGIWDGTLTAIKKPSTIFLLILLLVLSGGLFGFVKYRKSNEIKDIEQDYK